jgi:hypothetical protein
MLKSKLFCHFLFLCTRAFVTLVICTLLFLRQFCMGKNLLPKRFFAVLYRIVHCFRQHVLQLTHFAKTELGTTSHVDTRHKAAFLHTSNKLVIKPETI